mmetsp:Transcript_29300/g.51281  ORF Transcript_29300/g.51281 Transcript_29300/m.51281 type:complete len:141 (+) Transcript_29300:97-519(+)
MATPPNDGDFNPLNSAHKEIDAAMGIMRENMVCLQEREGRLVNLQEKSDTLQGTSGDFNRRAKRLRMEMRWQQYRLWVLAACLSIWLALFYVFRHHMKIFIAGSATVSVLMYLLQRFIQKRWRAQLESEDTRQLLGTGEP